MKPVTQTDTSIPSGNCLAACVASLLDLDIEYVPNFAALDKWQWCDETQDWIRDDPHLQPKWYTHLSAYCFGLGYSLLQLVWPNTNRWSLTWKPGSICIASVKRKRDRCLHCVLIDTDFKVVHDPHPDKKWQNKDVYDHEISDLLVIAKITQLTQDTP